MIRGEQSRKALAGVETFLTKKTSIEDLEIPLLTLAARQKTTSIETSLLLLLLLRLLIALSIVEPFKERLGSLADFLACGQVDIFVALLGAPVLEHVFGDEVVLVVGEQDLGNLGNKLGVFLADEAFGAAEEGFFVLFGSDHL